MASKFQNRLVGTVILVALVVIFLPDLMDGNKLEQKDEAFAKIPLRPELEPAKPALQVSAASTLPAEHLASQQQASAATQWQVEEIGDTVTLANQGGANPAGASQAPITQQQPVQAVAQPKPQPQPKPEPKPEVIAKKPVEQPKPKPVPTKPVEVQKPVEAKPQAGQIKTMDDLIASKMAQPTTAPAAPAQGSWILQLGAFKNADSVNALVSKLRAAGYSAQTSPRTPVQGQINRVFIGPDVSKAKLQGMQSRISQMTGLSGSVVAYNP
ncbi:cell division protein DedD [Aeromonas caviae]|uniref:cell division protein DedD n=1 Tax=Aeromonas TaxID=642 RepID=UPI000DEA6150|nr:MULTISPECIES: cell division protein DedD [Aeromonas]MBP4061714.1 cell division protein DedD [Aeromonas sp. Prich7-2]MCR3928760.1 cell division protein DedD [Aeromonas caviae]MDX7816050.1 cell division protein DedD [Aeromonas caviae]RCE22145.1 cell division protein DedD [Aeromonas caviae]RWT32120.1 cell division protein DedD [Aeromonas caviae]